MTTVFMPLVMNEFVVEEEEKMTLPNKGTYFPNPNDKRVFGIDISGNQGNINFDKINTSTNFPKVRFIIARTGISWAYKDAWFETYWQRMKQINVVRMAYHVLYPKENIKAQVDNMASRFSNKEFDGDGITADVELIHDASREQMSNATYEFVNRLRDWSKMPTFIYSRFQFVNDQFSLSDSWLKWYEQQYWHMANYSKTLMEFPTSNIWYPRDYMKSWKLLMHQTGEKGDGKHIGTVSAQVDTDRWCLSDLAFDMMFKVQAPVEPPVVIPPTLEQKVDRLWEIHPELH